MRTEKVKKQRILLAASALLLLLSQVLKTVAVKNPHMVEKYFSTGIYPVTSSIQTGIVNFIPFSMYEILIVIAILYGFYRIIRLIQAVRQKKFSEELIRFLLLITILVCTGLFLFQTLWSLNNYRIPLKDQLNLHVEETTVTDLANTYQALIDRANALRAQLTDEDVVSSTQKIQLILQTAWEGYKPLSEQYDVFYDRRVRVKGLWLSSRIQTISGYSGVYSFITGEPNINIEPPLVALPFSASHEIAHQMGITFEDEANYIGFLACKNHPNVLHQYSAYLASLNHVGNALYGQSTQLYWELSAKLSDEIQQDNQQSRDFWNSYENKVASQIADKVNESYLKSNNQKDGMQSYGKLVDLLIADYLADGEI